MKTKGVAGSPLAAWMHAFLEPSLSKPYATSGLSLHDPLAVWYALRKADGVNAEILWTMRADEDVRIETMGQWTRGACVVDKRGRPKRNEDYQESADRGRWYSLKRGNRIARVLGSPFWHGEVIHGTGKWCFSEKAEEMFGRIMVQRILGVQEG